MHPPPGPERLLGAIAVRLRPGGWVAVAAAIGGASALGVALLASAPADAAALGAGLAGVAAALGLAWGSARAASLPLEIGDLALRGEVDAVPVLRFRVRLGLGRAYRDPAARVWIVGDGAERELPVTLPSGRLVGPLTVVARDPERRATAASRLRIEVRVTGGGREWTAARELAAPTRTGWFDAARWDGVLDP